MTKFFRKTESVVTVEWVAIAAVMVLAAIGVTAYTMQAADGDGTMNQGWLKRVEARPRPPGFGAAAFANFFRESRLAKLTRLFVGKTAAHEASASTGELELFLG